MGEVMHPAEAEMMSFCQGTCMHFYMQQLQFKDLKLLKCRWDQDPVLVTVLVFVYLSEKKHMYIPDSETIKYSAIE